MTFRRFSSGLAAAIAALAIGASLAHAGGGVSTTARNVDDYEYWFDIVAEPATGPQVTSQGIVDDWFRDKATDSAAPVTSQGIVDDWFRDPPPPVTVSEGGFDWDDFGIGAGTMLGLILLLAGLAAVAVAARQGRGELRRT